MSPVYVIVGKRTFVYLCMCYLCKSGNSKSASCKQALARARVYGNLKVTQNVLVFLQFLLGHFSYSGYYKYYRMYQSIYWFNGYSYPNQ